MLLKTPLIPGATEYVVAKVSVAVGDAVDAYQELVSLETDKKLLTLNAPCSGVVESVLIEEGQRVSPKDPLVEIRDGAQNGSPASEKQEDVIIPQAPVAQDAADVVVIGGGVGGYVSAIYASKRGKRVTLVERERVGGTCLFHGCIPTKSLIASASLFHKFNRAADSGIVVGAGFRPNMPAMIGRKDGVVESLAQGLSALMEKNHVTVVKGTASFEGSRTVFVKGAMDRRIVFDQCVIATGSESRDLPVPGSDLVQVMDTAKALACTELPDSIVIVGGSVTGMEFAFMYRNLGSQVTVIARRPRVLHTFDTDLSDAALHSARALGIRVELGAEVTAFEEDADGRILVRFAQDGAMRHVACDQVLNAGGRTPCFEGLDLEKAGVTIDEGTGAIGVDEHMRTKAPRIYAVGDVNGLVLSAHAASYQARVAVGSIAGDTVAFDEMSVPNVAYTTPEIASVGMMEDVARERGITCSVGTFQMAHNGRALAEGEPEGFVKLITDEHGVVIGGAVVGAEASSLIATIGLAVSASMSAEELRRAVFAHPTTAEAIHEAAFDLAFGAIHE